MQSLVQIPWQRTMWVHPDFLAKLTLASRKLGRNIMLGSVRDPLGNFLAAWRDDYSTRYLWNGYVHHLPGFSSASDPDSGPRSHQRGVGGDLAAWPADLIAACRAVGIQVNGVPGEPWHIQLPDYLSYPIIRTNTAAASSGATPISPDSPATEEEDDVKTFLMRNADDGSVVWTDDQLLNWVPVTKGYIDYLKADGFIESADFMAAPNKNVAGNIFAWYQGIAQAKRAAVASLDPAPIAAAVIAAVGKLGVSVDASAVASAVEAALADNFAALSLKNQLR